MVHKQFDLYKYMKYKRSSAEAVNPCAMNSLLMFESCSCCVQCGRYARIKLQDRVAGCASDVLCWP